MTSPTSGPLTRSLGTGDAVVVGLSAMVGAGVFAVWAPAAEAAGEGLLVGLVIAAVVATCNGISSARLAAAYPTSGGTYVYGREVLGEWWGFLAGWAFVIGKTASCAAMAATFAAYAVPGAWQRPVAALAVVALTALTLGGVTRTALIARVLLGLTLLVVVAATALAWREPAAPDLAWEGGAYGVLQSAGLLFFAFAGYARIATLAEEVRRPELLVRAVLVALGVAVVLYAAVGVTLVHALGADLSGSDVPLVEAAGGFAPVVRIGAATAALGALLALLAGVGRTTLAMARERDLPGPLAAVSDGVPRRAQLAVGAAAVVLVLVADLRGAIGFSSTGVLVYYAVANLSAFRKRPGPVPVVGLVGCVVLVVTLPWTSLVAGLAVLAVGVLGRLVLRR